LASACALFLGTSGTIADVLEGLRRTQNPVAILRAMFDRTTFLASLAGSGILSIGVIRGLSGFLADRWMARYKTSLDKELEAYRDTLVRKRNQIEAELGHRTYVSKTQFDTEFNAIKDCFSALGKLRLSLNGLRPFMDWAPVDHEERVKLFSKRLDSVKERFNPFVDISESVYPFIPDDISDQFEICSKVVLLEIKHIEADVYEALAPTGYIEGNKAHEKFD
jgi:hypothetical protein